MITLKDFIIESNKITLHDLNGTISSPIDSNLKDDILVAIKDFIKDNNKIENITSSDVFDYLDPQSCNAGHYDGNWKSEWIQFADSADADAIPFAFVLFGNRKFDLNDIENFKFKNDKRTILFGCLDNGKDFIIKVPALIKYINENPQNELISSDNNVIEFTDDILDKIQNNK